VQWLLGYHHYNRAVPAMRFGHVPACEALRFGAITLLLCGCAGRQSDSTEGVDSSPPTDTSESCPPIWDGAPCASDLIPILVCDTCGMSYTCGVHGNGQPGNPLEWGHIGVPCECINDDGTQKCVGDCAQYCSKGWL